MYCPKRIAFSYPGMHVRTQLAVVDHNSGINRKQSQTKEGYLRFNTVFPKVTSSWVPKTIKEKKEKTFINDILEVLYNDDIHKEPVQLESTPKNIANVPYPGKNIVIASYSSRFVVKKTLTFLDLYKLCLSNYYILLITTRKILSPVQS